MAQPRGCGVGDKRVIQEARALDSVLPDATERPADDARALPVVAEDQRPSRPSLKVRSSLKKVYPFVHVTIGKHGVRLYDFGVPLRGRKVYLHPSASPVLTIDFPAAPDVPSCSLVSSLHQGRPGETCSIVEQYGAKGSGDGVNKCRPEKRCDGGPSSFA